MNKKYFAIATLGLEIFYSSMSLAADKNGVAAVVNGKAIKLSEIQAAYDTNPSINENTSFDEFYQNILDLFIDGEIVYQAAESAKIQESQEYAYQLKGLKRDLARKMYLEKQVKSKIDDKAVKKLYNDYKASFKGEQEIKAKHILVDSEAKAREVIEKLNKEGQFDKLAREYSKEPADLGYFSKGAMVPAFEDAAFKLKKGQYTKTPVQTQFGWHLIKLTDKQD